MKPTNVINKPLRAKAFGERFRQACDDNPLCPPKNQGRYPWLINEYKKLQGDEFSTETCRKWHEGETQAHRDKIHSLAKILGVDPIWLQTGFEPSQSTSDNDCKAVSNLTSATITIRPNVTVVIKNLPNDLTSAEANRITKIVQAYALDQ